MNQVNNFEYEAVGFATIPNDPNIISNIVIKDNKTGVTFNATILEAQQLVKEDKLFVPEPQ